MFKGVYKNKRVLVTGHTGFKGSWLCEWLLKAGAEVAGYSLYVPSEPSHYGVLGLSKKIKDYTGDVRSGEQVQKVFGEFKPEAVFHLAAQSLVRKSYDEPKLTFETNLGGTVNLLEAVRSSRCVAAAVFITSDKCYENVEWEFGYRETDRLGGKDPYSASKACAEIAFSAYVRSFMSGGPKAATARAGNVIGGGDWAADRIVPDCIQAWSKGKPAVIRSPHSTRPWQHVLEPLSGYLTLGAALLSGAEDLHGEAFNFGPPQEVGESVAQLIREMKKVWPKGEWAEDPAGEAGKKEAMLLKLNCDKAIRRLSWRPTLSFEESVRFTAEWYLKYYSENGGGMAAYTSDQIGAYEKLAAERNRVWTRG